MDPEHARLSTGVDEFWDDDDNTSVDFTPRRAHPDTIELVGAPGPPSGLDTNWWDSQDALWDAAESDPPAHAPLRAVNAAAATGLTIVVLAVGSPAADEQDPRGITPSRPSVASVEPAPSATAPPSAVAPPPPPAPPPPSAEQISPPSGGGGYRPRPRTATPQETDKPRIDVTRAPMSVAPEPRTPPKTAAPGGNSGNGGGWPW